MLAWLLTHPYGEVESQGYLPISVALWRVRNRDGFLDLALGNQTGRD